MLPDAVYMNCDLPSTVRALEDPELFLGGQVPGTVLVFDEVHHLEDPSRLLKIAADEYPQLKILATGSSTLAATRKFRDSLTGRKQAIHLCPVLWEHLVLDALRFRYADADIFYWQDKSHREVDFVVRRERNRVDLVECKINPDRLNTPVMDAFRSLYPAGDNYVVSPAVKKPYQIRRGDQVFTVCTTGDFPDRGQVHV